MYRTLIVKQPRADFLTMPVIRTAQGYEPFQTILIKTDKTNYRGDVLICAASGDVANHQGGCTCGLVELYDVKPVGQLTPEEWNCACVLKHPRKGYGWFFRNARRVVEMPFNDDGKTGFVGQYPKSEITEYPRLIMLDAKGLKIGMKQARKDGRL